MRSFRSKFIVTCSMLLFVLLSGCGEKKESSDKKASSAAKPPVMEKVTLRLAWVYDMAEVGILVAKEKGYFQKEGLDVAIEPGGFGLDPIKLVATGSNDYGIGGAGNILLARAQGVPIVAIAAEFQNTPVGFITHKNSGITSFAAFKGKRVGIQTGADTDVLYRALLAKNGMTSKDVKEVPIQFDMGPFVNNLIDVLPGYVTNQPITLKGKGFETNVITAASQGLSYYGNVFFTTEKTLKNNPEQVARFVRAARAGWEDALANKADAITALRKYSQEFDPKDLDQIYDAVMPFIRPDEKDVPLLGMSKTRWENTAGVLVGAGLVKQAPELSAVYSLKFVK